MNADKDITAEFRSTIACEDEPGGIKFCQSYKVYWWSPEHDSEYLVGQDSIIFNGQAWHANSSNAPASGAKVEMYLTDMAGTNKVQLRNWGSFGGQQTWNMSFLVKNEAESIIPAGQDWTYAKAYVHYRGTYCVGPQCPYTQSGEFRAYERVILRKGGDIAGQTITVNAQILGEGSPKSVEELGVYSIDGVEINLLDPVSQPVGLRTVTAPYDPDFDGPTFSGDCSQGAGFTASINLEESQNAVCTITYIYAPSAEPTLTVRLIGIEGGSGKVTVTAIGSPGFSCEGGNNKECYRSFPIGTSVSLSAVGTNDSTFSTWGGDNCSGNGICSATMEASKTITAAFSKSIVFTPGSCELIPEELVLKVGESESFKLLYHPDDSGTVNRTSIASWIFDDSNGGNANGTCIDFDNSNGEVTAISSDSECSIISVETDDPDYSACDLPGKIEIKDKKTPSDLIENKPQ